MTALVQFNRVTYTYARALKPAIEDISFEISAGEFVALIGPSGAGKSTLCYCFNGAIPQLFNGSMSGNLMIAGCDPFVDDIPILAQRVGLVVQNARTQLFNVSVIQEVGFGCENLGLPREQILERISQALDFVDLAGYEDRAPNALSGGQQQRLAIACVLAMDPQIMVLDEPTSELDPVGAEQVMDVIARLNRDLGKTIILVTHDMEFVTRYATRVMLLNDRSLVMDDTPRMVFSNVGLLTQARIRPPQVCEVGYQLRERGFTLEPLPVSVAEMVHAVEALSHG